MRTKKTDLMNPGNTVNTPAGHTISIIERKLGSTATEDMFVALVDGKERELSYMSLYSLMFVARRDYKYTLSKPFGDTIKVRSKKAALDIIQKEMGVSPGRATAILKANDSYVLEEI